MPVNDYQNFKILKTLILMLSSLQIPSILKIAMFILGKIGYFSQFYLILSIRKNFNVFNKTNLPERNSVNFGYILQKETRL